MVDFILQNTEDASDVLIFPVTPPSIKLAYGLNTKSIDTAAVGEVKIPINAKLRGASWDSFLPGPDIQDFSMVHDWQPPEDILQQIERWINNKTILQLLVTETPVVFKGFVEDWNPEPVDGNGSYPYSLTFTEYRSISIRYIGTQATTTKSTNTPAVGGSGAMTQASNVWSGPGYTYQIIGTIKKGAAVKVVAANGSWRKITYGTPSATGWVPASIIQKTAGTTGTKKSTGSHGPKYKLPRWYTTTGKEHGIADVAVKFYGKSSYTSYIYDANSSLVRSGLMNSPMPKGLALYIPVIKTKPTPKKTSSSQAGTASGFAGGLSGLQGN